MELSLFSGELTAPQKEAVELHFEIKKNGELAAAALVEFCKGLKKMRDSKLFAELGYETFEIYAETEFNLKQRQAYNYIQALENLGEPLLQSNAKIGITKLKILSELPRIEAADFIEKNDVDEMSARELKEAIKKLTEQEEQITFLTSENARLAENEKSAETAQTELENIKNALAEKERELIAAKQELKEAQNRPVEVSVREPSADEIKKLTDKAVKEAKEEAAKKALEQVSAEAEKSAKKLAELEEKYKSMISSAEREKQEAADRLAAVEKSAKIAANPDVLKFSFYFEEAQKNIGKMKDILATLDGETAEKLKKALAAVAAQITNN